MTGKSYEEIVREKRAWYKVIRKKYCPILKTDVFFTSKGFHHLLYDGLGHARSNKERMYRLGLLPLAMPVLKCAQRVEEYKPSAYSKSLNKNVEYWSLQAIVGKQNTLVTLVLRRIGTGNITFYSIWKKRGKQTKKLSK